MSSGVKDLQLAAELQTEVRKEISTIEELHEILDHKVNNN